MKKNVFIICFTLFLFLLVGCSNDTNKEKAEEFTIEKALENGDIVAKPDGTVENLTKMFEFIDQMEKKEKANIQISTFREDGKVLINELKYDGNEIEFIDKTKSGEVIKTFQCTSLDASTIFSLEGCNGDLESVGLLSVSEAAFIRAEKGVE